MLYQPTSRPTLSRLIVRAIARFGAFFAALGRESADRRYLDRLSARELGELGLHRVEDNRWNRFY